MTLHIMIGLPGSGKSTFAERMDARVFSSDRYREKLLGDVNDQSQNKKVFDTLYADLKEYLRNNCYEECDVILDATNLTVKSRKRAIEIAKSIDFIKVYAVVVATPIKDCIANNFNRERVVPVETIFNMMKKFEFPQKFEGFDGICVIAPHTNTAPSDKCEMIERMFAFDQQNKHHMYSLGHHCAKLASNYEYGSILYWAAMWHDVGKMFTQSLTEDGQAHYYSHENVSTYYAVSEGLFDGVLNGEELYEALFYINNHMHIRDILKSDKAVERYKKLWGEERFRNLVDFMNNDNGASGRIMNEGCEK